MKRVVDKGTEIGVKLYTGRVQVHLCHWIPV